MNNQPLKIVVDTCVLYTVYGAAKNKIDDKKFNKMSGAEKILFLAQKGVIEMVATPQIFKEFLCARGDKHQRFDEFVQKYLTVLTYDKKQAHIVADMTYSFGHDRIHKSGSNKKQPPFPKAQKPGDRNYADCTIMAEATLAGLDILTNNYKDFRGFKYLDPLVRKHGITKVPYVFTPNEFFTQVIREPINKKQNAFERLKESELTI